MGSRLEKKPTVRQAAGTLCYCNTCGGGSGYCKSKHGCVVYEGYGGIAKQCHRPTSDILNICSRKMEHNFRLHCCNTSYCNTKSALPAWPQTTLAADIKSSTARTESLGPEWFTVAIISGVIFGMIALIKLLKKFYQSNPSLCNKECRCSEDADQLSITSRSSSSGSGRQYAWLVPKRLSHNITLLERIAKGKYGTDGVFRAKMHGKDVAVKILPSKDTDKFETETDFYCTSLLSHENILAYIGSDTASHFSCTEMWIVTQYHPNGSLQNHVADNQPINVESVLKLLMTAATGLRHLHTEIKGTTNKPAMAHRDIKTRNILVKVDGSCCVADFGLAVVAPVDHHIKYKVGTKRYAAPEILNDTIDVHQISSFQRSDVYAFSLLMWEVLTNCTQGYKLPYDGQVECDPSFDDMKEVVCTRGYRPAFEFPDTIPVGIRTTLAVLIRESWGLQHRHSMLRIEKTLTKLYESNYMNVDHSKDQNTSTHA